MVINSSNSTDKNFYFSCFFVSSADKLFANEEISDGSSILEFLPIDLFTWFARVGELSRFLRFLPKSSFSSAYSKSSQFSSSLVPCVTYLRLVS